MTDFDNTDRYDWLRPVGIAATEADILAHGLQDPLTLLYDLKAGDYYIAFDEERASGMAADMAEEAEATAEQGLDALGLDAKNTVDIGTLSQGQRAVAEALADLDEGQTVTTFDMERLVDYQLAHCRHTLRRLWEAGLATREGSQNEGYEYAPTAQLKARLENEDE